MQNDIIVPVLILIQANSPQTIKKSDAYIEGCAAGDMINSLTRENYGDSLIFIPIKYRRTFREHAARTTERLGEFITEHEQYDVSKLIPNDRGFNCINPTNEHEIVQTANDLVMLLPGATVKAGKVMFKGELEPIMIRSKFTKWRMAKQLNSLAKRLTVDVGNNRMEAPRYAGYYNLKSAYIEDAENPYYNYSVEYLDWVSEDHFTQVEGFYNALAGKSVSAVGDDEGDTY